MHDIKLFLSALGFLPKENASAIFAKKYADGYVIEVDVKQQAINYGDKIVADSKTTQNFSMPENFVVLECVNRLLEKGYPSENIFLEKTWGAGHGTSGRLDICVTRNDGSEYLLIECKNYGHEFDREFARMKKDGGQLFTYFKFSNKPDVLMLYASELQGHEIVYRNEIVKIEDDYRTGDVKDFYERWNKLTHNVGVWENPPYNFAIQKFTKDKLQKLNEAISQKLFNGFASILRKHSVSDKPNAFNVIFNLFLAKLYDEQKRNTDELEFHWRADDDPVDFQVRLYNLHKAGLLDFLKKEIEGIEDSDFKTATPEELRKAKKKFLKFNKLFDIKSVLDDNDFEQNHRVLKEVVKLIEKYQIRYPHKQRHLSEFFELLLTTGLKQEAGQYFTPPPIAKFIIKSLPLYAMVEKEINNVVPKLPAVIDYAAGSGHFITEIMEEYQNIINKLDTKDYFPKAITEVQGWRVNPYSWAAHYVYGIEKDYRLVKVAKVGCYFYGDGLAQIVHGDGLDSFASSKSYVGLLKENTNTEDSAKNKFSIVVSNPPYSVNDCKDDLDYIGSNKEFTLYPYLTDNSDDIECLFVERTKQLLKDDGVAGIILPSPVLSNNDPFIYVKTREIILQYFEIIAITELGSNTFMATGKNTVVLFLRRRSDKKVHNIKTAAYRLATEYPKTHEDITINGIETPVQKYFAHTGETTIDPEKLYYFILTYPQKVVIVRTGKKDDEKLFLGYKFSDTKGKEGMHSVQIGKSVDECTRLYDNTNLENLEKASTYIYKAFAGDFNFPVNDSLKDNISRIHLIDMLNFDYPDFKKTISTTTQQQAKFELQSKYAAVRLGEIATVEMGNSAPQDRTLFENGIYPFIRTADVGKVHLSTNLMVVKDYLNDSGIKGLKKFTKGTILLPKSGASTYLNHRVIMGIDGYIAAHLAGITANQEKILTTYLYGVLVMVKSQNIKTNSDYPSLNKSDIVNIKVPLPPMKIQQKIAEEIEALEEKSKTFVIADLGTEIEQILNRYLQ
jgi:type I restriction enzyme M protein